MIIHSACKFDINVDSNIEIPEFEGRSLINTITEEAKSDEKIDFTIPSSDTNGKGVYVVDSTKNDENPIYYYRGEIDYNNVLFRGFCFKILRTTSEGGIKLIYSGMPNEGKCNNKSFRLSFVCCYIFCCYISPARNNSELISNKEE